MGFLGAWLALELRRRWRMWLALTLLVAFALATVLTAVAGARRGAGALDRLRAVTRPADALVSNQDPDLDWNRVRALPGVEAVAPYAITGLHIDDMPFNWLCVPPVDDAMWRDLERPVVLAGRLPDPRRADEVVVQWRFTRLYGKGVGDTVRIQLNTPEKVDLVADAGGAMQGGQGPTVTATIVGIIRSPYFSDGVDGPGVVLPSPGLFRKYRDNLMGADHRGFSVALVRLTDGADGVERLRTRMAALTGHPIPIDRLADTGRRYDRLLNYEAVSLLAFALAALAAATLLIGQHLLRSIGGTLAELRTLRVSGLTPRQEALAAALGPAAATAVGAVLGVCGAAAASPWMPIGAAANFEPHPGLDIDPVVLLPPLIIVPLLAVGTAVAGAWIGRFATGRNRGPRASALVSAAARAGLPVPVVTGLRYALGRGQALPIRSAMSGTLAGVLGVTAAFTFSAGVGDAAEHPERFGQTHQLLVFLGYNREGATGVLPKVAADPDVLAVADERVAAASTGGNPYMVYGPRPVRNEVPPVVVTGRPPVTDADVLLAVTTAARLNAKVGDVIRLTGREAAADFRVSAIGFVPMGVSNTYDDGAQVTAAGYDRVFHSFDVNMGLVVLGPGADVGTVSARLSRLVGRDVGLVPAIMPPQLNEIRDVRVLPGALAAFLALLAVAAAAHAVTITARRRRHDIAVLRALGMTRVQARMITLTQAGTLAAIGLLAGVPLGLVTGRALWRLVADNTPMVYVPPVPVTTLALIAPVTLAAAAAVAARPARAVARLAIAPILRAE
ncbi:FtsX-like permease family protein [Microbispora sp. NPDC049125]|uniref:FtsX-like permease family protein n=1 Tax=Microbispora sp. NPDC049125 TaxID=3154929 RepID=UPI003465981C